MTTWLPTLKTATPQEGYELAVATHYATVAAANDYWRDAP